MNRKNVILMTCLIVSLASGVLLTGCTDDKDPLFSESKASLVEMVNSLNSDLNEEIVRNEELEEKLKEEIEEKGPTPGIEVIDDLTGAKSFIPVDNTISFPNELSFPGSVQAPNTSKLSISEAVSISPSGSWICQINGTDVELNHNSGISGKIAVGTLSREAQKFRIEELETVLSEFAEPLPTGNINYSRIHLGKNWFGQDACCSTTVDSKPGEMRFGLIGYGDVAVQYMFVYTGSKDQAKDETILNLIKTMIIRGTQISIQ